jgi:hypothetical protein
VDHVGDVPLI